MYTWQNLLDAAGVPYRVVPRTHAAMKAAFLDQVYWGGSVLAVCPKTDGDWITNVLHEIGHYLAAAKYRPDTIHKINFGLEDGSDRDWDLKSEEIACAVEIVLWRVLGGNWIDLSVERLMFESADSPPLPCTPHINGRYPSHSRDPVDWIDAWAYIEDIALPVLDGFDLYPYKMETN